MATKKKKFLMKKQVYQIFGLPSSDTPNIKQIEKRFGLKAVKQTNTTDGREMGYYNPDDVDCAYKNFLEGENPKPKKNIESLESKSQESNEQKSLGPVPTEVRIAVKQKVNGDLSKAISMNRALTELGLSNFYTNRIRLKNMVEPIVMKVIGGREYTYFSTEEIEKLARKLGNDKVTAQEFRDASQGKMMPEEKKTTKAGIPIIRMIQVLEEMKTFMEEIRDTNNIVSNRQYMADVLQAIQNQNALLESQNEMLATLNQSLTLDPFSQAGGN
jgi:hypothetical protein